MDKLTPLEALELIESICYDMNPQEDNEALNLIYPIVHCTIGDCKNEHKDWNADARRLYEQSKR